MGIGILTTLWCKEPAETTPRVYEGATFAEKAASWFLTSVVEPLQDFVRRFGRFALVVLVFVSFYRISDYVLGILANPFYLDIGYSKSQVATVAKVYGAWVTIAGIGLGGWAVLKFGVARCIVTATILIASTNLFFAIMVYVGAEIWMLAVTISADNFAMGFGGTVFIAYLSSLVNQSFTATQYALMSSLMSILGKFTAGYSGNVQEAIGWMGFFVYAAALGGPAILLSIVVARYHDRVVGSNGDA
jgi:PAT family beta-lactamase induction signal transducer AmpG